MEDNDPGRRFHQGERLMQLRAGETVRADRNAAVFADVIAVGARAFLATQRMIAMGTRDAGGTPVASLIFGAPDFVSTTDGSRVIIKRKKIIVDEHDPLWATLHVGAPIGLLAIEFDSRRRLRINGDVTRCDETRIDVTVREAYPNCHKYIQRRHLIETGDDTSGDTPITGHRLDAERHAFVRRVDTLFLVSGHPTRGIDVSHRGGKPGFVRVLGEDVLRVPDYPGNSLFNSLGNLMVDPRAALALIDFEHARVLQMQGIARVHLGLADDPEQPSGGTCRYWDFRLTRWIERALPKKFRVEE